MIIRRSTALVAIVTVLAAWRPLPAQEAAKPRTYVLVHGAWGGGWDWRKVSDLLTSRGHTVFRVTLTGLGERAHLASANIGLETHITDVVNTILYESLREVVLVGHSYGGMVVTGGADRVPNRIAHVAYVDAFVPEDGERVMDLVAARGGAPPGEAKDGFLIPAWVAPGTAPPHDVPQPLKTFTDPIVLKNQARTRIPATYILTVDKGADTDPFDPSAARAKKKGWRVERLTADHNAQRSAPEELARLLDALR
jgi:pimeloyl-ACP methyl ester carboxylesterase